MGSVLQTVKARRPQLSLTGLEPIWAREPSKLSSQSSLPELGHTGEKLPGREPQVNCREETKGKTGPDRSGGRDWITELRRCVSRHVFQNFTKITKARALELKPLLSNHPPSLLPSFPHLSLSFSLSVTYTHQEGSKSSPTQSYNVKENKEQNDTSADSKSTSERHPTKDINNYNLIFQDEAKDTKG